MSRKSRHHRELQLVRESPTDPLESEHVTVHRLTGELQQTLEAIVSGCVLLAKAPTPPDFLDLDDDDFSDLEEEGEVDDVFGHEVAASFDETADAENDDELVAALEEVAFSVGAVGLTTRVLARALISRVLGRASSQTDPLSIGLPERTAVRDEREEFVVDELTRSLLASGLPPELKPSRADRKAVLNEVAALIEEIGLEEFDEVCSLHADGGGTPELYTSPVSPERAHLLLLDNLLDRAEAAAYDRHVLLAAERRASAWEFSRWSVSPPPGAGSPEMLLLAREIRELEYSLADRSTVTLGESLIDELAGDDGFAELFPRQHRMAEALARSFVDVCECVALDGTHATFESVRGRISYDVYEHTDPPEYDVGWLCIGRLLPFGAIHLRAPSMIFVRPDKGEIASTMASALDSLEDTIPPALALEAVISSMIHGVHVPRDVKPAQSRAQAREALESIRGLLDELTVDATLVSFLAALEAQAEAGGGREDKHRAKRQTKKSKRRR